MPKDTCSPLPFAPRYCSSGGQIRYPQIRIPKRDMVDNDDIKATPRHTHNLIYRRLFRVDLETSMQHTRQAKVSTLGRPDG